MRVLIHELSAYASRLLLVRLSRITGIRLGMPIVATLFSQAQQLLGEPKSCHTVGEGPNLGNSKI